MVRETPVGDLMLVEVSPRDGLQNEPRVLSVADRVALIARAVTAGARRIEVASFVNPARVPQMAAAEEVIAALPRGGAQYIGLVLNRRGADRALATAIDQIGLVVPVTDAFAQRNQAQTADECIAMAADVLRLARERGRSAQVTIAVAFGCPFEGAVPADRVVAVARRLAASGPCEIALADTLGVATPAQVTALIGAAAPAIGNIPLRVHFHDTRGTGVANACAAVAAGVRTIDAAIGGTGGCPFAPGAAGNVATEDVVYALGDRFAIDLRGMIATANWLGKKLGRPPASALAAANPFGEQLQQPGAIASNLT